MSESDKMKQHGQKVAQAILEALDAPDDPDHEQKVKQREAQDSESLESFYYQTGQKKVTPGRARTSAEMRFATSLQPCPHCGARAWKDFELRGDDTSWMLTARCGSCNKPKGFAYRTMGDPHALQNEVHDLGPGPSGLITPEQFLGELERVLPEVDSEPTKLGPAAWKVGVDANRRALICLNELIKLIPKKADAIPGVADPHARRSWLESERANQTAILGRYVADKERNGAATPAARAPETLTREKLSAHQQWMRQGRRGAGRLELAGTDLHDAKIGAAELTGAKLVDVKLAGADLAYAHLDEAELRGVDFTRANLASASFNGAAITGGSFAGANMSLAELERATVEGADFTKADLELADWRAARVTRSVFAGARFGNGRLDAAVFTACDFTGASFALIHRLPLPTTNGTRFEGSDLRDTDWTGRDLSGATFVRCKLAGAHGKPKAMAGMTVQDCDVDADALQRQLS